MNEELEDKTLIISWRELREQEYRKLNQLEMIYDDKINGTTVWEDTINSIKQKYPKPEDEL
ncbi:MAG: hypothetical protein ACQERD_01005 [Campylobacterota bacterium]